MIVKELILQGIKRFKGPIRFQLQEGLNVFYGINEKGKTTVSDALFFLFSLGSDQEQKKSLNSYDAKEIRLGVTFKEGPDNYRLLMDLVSEAVVFSKYNREAKKFNIVAKDIDEIRDFFKRELLFEPLDQYKNLYLIDSYSLVIPYTHEPVQIEDTTSAFTLDNVPDNYTGQIDNYESTSFGGYEDQQQDGMTKEEIQSKIEELEKELALSSNAAAQQDKIDQLESNLTDIQSRINTVKSSTNKLHEIEKQVNELNKFSDLPEDIEKRVDEHIQFEAKIKKDIESIERQKSQYADINIDMLPFYKDRIFIAGAIVTFLFILIPTLLSIFVGSWGMYLSAGIFAGLIMMGYALWNDTGKRTEINKKQARVSELEKQIKEQRKKYEIEGSVITSIINSMNLESPSVLKEGIKRYKVLLDQFADVKKEYNAVISGNNTELLRQQEEQTKSEIDSLQEQLRTATGSGVDPYSISQQIEALKKRLNDAGNDHAQPKEKPPVPNQPEPKAEKTEIASVPSFMKHINSISELMNDSKDHIISLAASSAGSYFKTLTNGTFEEISFADNKIVPIKPAGKGYEFRDLSGSAKEKGMFSIFLSLLDLVSERWPWPVIMDEPFMVLDESNRTAVYNMVKSLSKKTQIFFLTKDISIKPLADAFITL